MSRPFRTVAVLVLAPIILVLLATPVAAQVPPPVPTPTPTPTPVPPLRVAALPWVVLDVRGGFASLGSDTTTSADLGVLAADMPSRAKTIFVGVHLYPIRKGGFKLGLGAEGVRGATSNQRLDSTGEGTGPIIRRRLEGASGQLSLNFGKGKGWSYITVGGGPMKFESYLDDAKPTRAGTTTLNYGGGARWFTRGHLAFTVDLRLYLTRPATATLDAPARVRKRVALLSIGLSIK